MNSLGTIAAGMVVLLVEMIVAGALAYGLYRLTSLPLRRRERERWLLDVIETALQRGHSPEQAIEQPTSGGEQTLGLRFAPVAAQVRRGG